MQRAERRQALIESRQPRTLLEADYFLGVTDVSRLGALRFMRVDQNEFQKPTDEGVPGFIHLGRLLDSAERIERNSETDEAVRARHRSFNVTSGKADESRSSF